MLDIFYHFNKSLKRKAGLAEYCTFCDVEFRHVLKHVSTSKATNWVVKVFQSWIEQQGKQEDGICSVDLFESKNVEFLNFCLSHFVVEARRKDGNLYPLVTIHNLLLGLHRYSKSKVPSGSVAPNSMNSRDPGFQDLRSELQVHYRQLCIDSVGASVKHSTIVTLDEENMLLRASMTFFVIRTQKINALIC